MTIEQQNNDVLEVKPGNGLGFAALALGAAGVLIGIAPIGGAVAAICGIGGVTFGLMGLSRIRRGTATNPRITVAGVVLSAVAIIVGIWGVASVVADRSGDGTAGTRPQALTTATVSRPPAALRPTARPTAQAPTVPTSQVPTEPAPSSNTITYEVTGDGVHRANNISYIKDSNFGQQQANGVSLPWSTQVEIESSGLGRITSLVAQSGSGGNGSITCRILDSRGNELASSTSSGPYAVVTCASS